MTFNETYLASLDPARAALITQQYHQLIDSSMTLYNPILAKSLLNNALLSGLPIDFMIMMNGWDALTTMSVRINDGYDYVPAYGQPNINVAPGLSMPGVPSNYQVVPPAGSIKVSINPVDYPPFNPPSIPVPTAPITVGPFELSGIGSDGLFHYYFGVNGGDTSRVGTVVNFDGQNYVKIALINNSPMGNGTQMILWQLMPTSK